MESVIREYLREYPEMLDNQIISKGNPFGVMTATLRNGKLAFGWSVCHINDTFDKRIGNLISTNRMNQFDPCVEDVLIVPEDMCEAMERFIERAQRYFRVTTSIRVLNGFDLSRNR